MIAIPGLDASHHAVPLEHILVGIADHAGVQRDDRIRNLEGRGRQPALARAHLVAGDDQVIVNLVADEGAGGAEVEKPLGQIVAKLAALVGDIGETTVGKNARGGEKTERMAAIDHGFVRTG